MDKIKMLSTIDNLLYYLKGNEDAIDMLVAEQLKWADSKTLEESFYSNQCTYYRNNPESFKEDYYWEFCTHD